MWKNATDVPKQKADNILERFDQTDPAMQRMIMLQFILDLENERQECERLRALCPATATTRHIGHRANGSPIYVGDNVELDDQTHPFVPGCGYGVMNGKYCTFSG